MKMKDYYMEVFGQYFGASEAAPKVYQRGWNDALEEAAIQIKAMPFGKDTVDSFAAFLRGLKEEPMDMAQIKREWREAND